MVYTKGKKLWKYYREGYNNPNQFTEKTLNQDNDVCRAVVAGVCQRKQDDASGTTKFKQ